MNKIVADSLGSVPTCFVEPDRKMWENSKVFPEWEVPRILDDLALPSPILPNYAHSDFLLHSFLISPTVIKAFRLAPVGL